MAHIAEDGREQSVLEHLTGTAELCARFAAAFGAEEQGRLAGMAHDIGKYSEAFQRRLRGSSEKVDHSTAGAIECFRSKQPYAAFAVAGHHGGLPDGGTETDRPELSTLYARINRAKTGNIPDYGDWAREVDLPQAYLPPFSCRPDRMFFIRMLYSCLVDADFLDTEQFMKHGHVQRGSDLIMNTLCRRLLDHKTIKKWCANYDASSLNGRRSEILRACIAAGEDPAPLRTLTVPTGGGKTISSLAYALVHAVRHGKDRIIYVIPYTSIIEQTADEFRKYLGNEAVLEHHYGVDYAIDQQQDEKAEKEISTQALATENWDAPIIVTTAVQFFESLFSDRPARCRKLHNIANSVVIFDEAQMLPISYLRPCVWAISQLVRHYQTTAVLCTATQPALNDMFGQFDPGLILEEIAPDAASLTRIFRRVTYRQLGVLDITGLSERLNQEPQVLCIVNTRKDVRTIFDHLEPNGAFHLSTWMYPNHRRAVIQEIKRRLDAKESCRVIATSLIECGVDVDFPTVYREAAGLDSILQAGGRCNREGKNAALDSIVSVFQLDRPVPPIFDTVRGTYQSVLALFPDLSAPETIQAYFRLYRKRVGKQGMDIKEILEMMEGRRNGNVFPFRQIAHNFHLIEANTRTVYIPADENAQKLIEQLQSGHISRSLFRQLGQYGVNVYWDDFRRAAQDGHIEIWNKDDEFSPAVLLRMKDYDDRTGLKFQQSSAEDYMV